MLGMKILPIQANATNTVALWPGQLTSVAATIATFAATRAWLC
jgi:hypothetical protein